MSNALTGWGVTVKLHNGTALTSIAEVFGITVPDAQADEVDVTHYLSAGRSREFIAGMVDHGEIEIQMNYVPGSATDVLLTDAKSDGDVRTWEITCRTQRPAGNTAAVASSSPIPRTSPLTTR